MTNIEKQELLDIVRNLFSIENDNYENIITTLNMVFVILIFVILYNISISNLLKKKLLNMEESNKKYLLYIRKNLEDNDTKCTICYEKKRDVILYPCRHLVSCQNCAENIKILNDSKCPFCRKKYSHYDKIYW